MTWLSEILAKVVKGALEALFSAWHQKRADDAREALGAARQANEHAKEAEDARKRMGGAGDRSQSDLLDRLRRGGL